MAVRATPLRTAAHPAEPVLPLGALSAMLFISGAVALVYEVAWQRQFSSALGSTTSATATVLAAYFAGLGLGALLAGKVAARVRRPLRAYAIAEVLVGVGAWMVTPLMHRAEFLFADVATADHGSVALLLQRTAFAFAALALPTLAMGATLPLLARLLEPSRRRGAALNQLYAVNTAGAALGALALPFLLLPWLGVQHSITFGAGANFLLALLAWWLDRSTSSTSEPATAPRTASEESTARKTGSRNARSAASPTLPAAASLSTGVRLGLSVLSGFVTFALQVLWNRAFAQVHENSMHAFAVIVSLVILALAAGAVVARKRLQGNRTPRRVLGGAWVLAGATVLAGPWCFVRWTDGLRYLAEQGSFTAQAATLAGLGVGTVFVPMLLLGVAVPALLDDVARDANSATSGEISRLLFANIVGAVGGALAGGLLLPTWLGTWNATFATGALVSAVGAALWLTPAKTSALVRLRLAGLGALALALTGLLSRSELPRVRLARDGGERLVFLAEGAHGITAVTERDGSRRLKLNNHYALGGTAATGDERLQAHIPLLLHPAPKRVAFLGLGTAISAGGAQFHPVERTTLVELVPEVVTAAREHFHAANAGVLDDPRSIVVYDDARHYLAQTRERFDVIVGDLVVPWRPGEGALFTREHFAAARLALNDGGIYCQWLPLFQLSEEQFQILTRTFLAVFPRAWVFRGDFSPQQPALALIGGGDDGFLPDATIVRRRLAELRADAANPQLRQPEVFWLGCIGGLDRTDLPSDDGRLNTEDRPWVELLGAAHDARDPRRTPFIGRPLQSWMEAVHQRSRDTPRALSDAERAAFDAGPVLGEMTLQLQLGNETAVRAAQTDLQRRLPPAVRQALFGQARERQ